MAVTVTPEVIEASRPPEDTGPIADFKDLAADGASPSPKRRSRRTRAEIEAAGGTPSSSTRGSVGKWSEQDLALLQGAFITLALMASNYFGTRFNDPTLTMQEQEARGIAEPAVRIIARHVKLKHAAPGDVADVVALTVAMAAYGMRVYQAKQRSGVNPS